MQKPYSSFIAQKCWAKCFYSQQLKILWPDIFCRQMRKRLANTKDFEPLGEYFCLTQQFWPHRSMYCLDLIHTVVSITACLPPAVLSRITSNVLGQATSVIQEAIQTLQ